MTNLDAEELQLRHALLVVAEASVEVDVDVSWTRVASTLRSDARRSAGRRLAAVAAAVILLVTAGRPIVDTGATALAQFIGHAARASVDGVVGMVADSMSVDGGGGAHGKIDRSNPFWVEVRGAHNQLNGAVGWNRWRPGELDGAAERLERVAGQDPQFGAQALEAARLIRTAVADDDRESAVLAHRAVEAIEVGLRSRQASSGSSRP
jgi:hypothetical protein